MLFALLFLFCITYFEKFLGSDFFNSPPPFLVNLLQKKLKDFYFNDISKKITINCNITQR